MKLWYKKCLTKQSTKNTQISNKPSFVALNGFCFNKSFLSKKRPFSLLKHTLIKRLVCIIQLYTEWSYTTMHLFLCPDHLQKRWATSCNCLRKDSRNLRFNRVNQHIPTYQVSIMFRMTIHYFFNAKGKLWVWKIRVTVHLK